MAKISAAALDAFSRPVKRKHIRSGNIVEKIAATAKFHTELINQIDNEQKQRIQIEGLRYIAKYFEAYVDNIARSNPSRYHHIYEPDMIGQKTGRLFASTISATAKPVLSYNFLPSKKPMDSGYVFTNKAFVMENQIPLTIQASDNEYLTFEYKGEFYSKKKVFVAHPGGQEVSQSFSELFNIFMTNTANDALKELGFFDRIERGIQSESRIVLSKISAGKIEGMASEAAKAAENITRRLR